MADEVTDVGNHGISNRCPLQRWTAPCPRGYGVLQVNFRGSRGYGKEFINAGNREWGAKMQTDLIDAVNWAVDQGIADPDRVAIYGGSYGGYATLAALTFTPEVFRCGVDIVGPSNLITLLESIPARTLVLHNGCLHYDGAWPP